MKTTDQNPVNAGSMADIAFLLLIFFLVSTTIQTDVGINQKLPPECKGDCSSDIKENNVLEISLNKNNELMLEGKEITLPDLKDDVKQFIDNNKDATCHYCSGLRLKNSSDNPKKAVISIKTNREASYKAFVAVQNSLMQSYTELRQNYASKIYNKNLDDLSDIELRETKKAYPQIISEAEIH